jgi:putative flavoprotein involved in K+ transport
MRCIDASTYNPQRPGRRSTSPNRATNTGYRQSRDIPAGTVLVVGGGNTGFQIAAELTGTHAVHLSVGSRQTPLPQKVWHRDLFWWLTKTGLLNMTVDSRLGRRLSERETLIGSSPKQLRRLGVDLHPRAVNAARDTVSFADGTQLRVDAVVSATGYQPDYSWIEAPVLDAAGRVRHYRGVTNLPWTLLSRPVLATHPRLSVARLGKRRRRVHRHTDPDPGRHPHTAANSSPYRAVRATGESKPAVD